MKTFQRPFKYLMQNKMALLLGISSLLIVDMLQLFIPKIIQHTIDDLLAGSLVEAVLWKNVLLLLLFALGIGFFRIWWRYYIQGTSFKIEEGLRNDLFGHLLKMDRTFFHNHKVGDLMAYSTNDLTSVRMVFGLGFVAFFDGICFSLASIGFMLYINPALTMWVILPLPVLTIIVTYLGRLTHKRFGSVQETFAELSAKAQESFAGIRIVKGFGQEGADSKDFALLSKKVVDKNISLAKIGGLFHPLMMAISGVSLFIIIFWGGQLSVLQEISVGEFVAFTTYLGMLTWPMMAIGWVMNLYQRGKASMERINNILSQTSLVEDSEEENSLCTKECDLEIRDLSFVYPNSQTEVLKKINLKIPPHQRVALVGKTGSGKSTLLNILTRQFNPTAGEILINKRDYSKYSLEELRKFISVVPQETFLFSQTIADNIAYAKPDSTFDEITTAAKNSCVYENILDLPNQFETMLGEKGVNLSGGQKQRIAIARALLKDAPLIIMDDSLSAVDTQTEEKILENLSLYFKDRSSLVVAHRISSIRSADYIYVLDEGEICEEGTHQQLISQNGIYADMFNKQQLEESLKDA